ncbi:MAG: helix-turn-helix transcriptional regulator [Candidatus Sericytochromatia bacterium]|nr:helix-turn-helix transcriptional regulator [Candidatus Tanganyikabacteria bacterium]
MAGDLKRRLGMRIRAARQRRGLTQEELGARLRRTTETVSNLERGRVLPSLPTLEVLCRVLELPLRELFEEMPGRQRSGARLRIEARLGRVLDGMTDREAELALRMVELLVGRGESGRKP